MRTAFALRFPVRRAGRVACGPRCPGELLRGCEFSINHAVNGVAATLGFHTGLRLHSAPGIDTVVNALQAAFAKGGCTEMVSELRSIAQAINAGTFKVKIL